MGNLNKKVSIEIKVEPVEIARLQFSQHFQNVESQSRLRNHAVKTNLYFSRQILTYPDKNISLDPDWY